MRTHNRASLGISCSRSLHRECDCRAIRKVFRVVIRIRRPILAVCLALIAITLVNVIQFSLYPTIASVVSSKIGRRIPVYSVDVEDDRVSVSLDATWGASRTQALLDVLDKHGVKATFFLAGYWIKEYPDHVRMIAARGHEIGNHSYSHPHLNSLSADSIATELDRCSDMIESLTGKRPVLFRPPFGEYNNRVIETAEACGLTTIQWDVDSLDWQNLSKSEIVNRVMSRVKRGSIILFHNDGLHTVEALDTVLGELKNRGFTIVPISLLLLTGETYVDHTGRQKAKPGSPRTSSVESGLEV